MAYRIFPDIFCIMIIVLLKNQSRINTKNTISTDTLSYNRLQTSTLFVCVFDLFAALFNKTSFSCSQIILELSYLFYLIFLELVAYFWFSYAERRINSDISEKKGFSLKKISLWIIILFTFSSIFTNSFFSIEFIDEVYVYKRGPLLFVNWIYIFILVALVLLKILLSSKNEESELKNSEKKALSIFGIIPCIFGITQIFIPDFSIVQCGITFGIIMVFMHGMGNLIHLDELTGLNNRLSLTNYFETSVYTQPEAYVTIFMIDVDKFKYINDTFGHSQGDKALKTLSEILKFACNSVMKSNCFLCRYGGDEFLIVAKNLPEKNQNDFLKCLQTQIDYRNSKLPESEYFLSVSVGFSTGKCDSLIALERLLASADENMYEQKQIHHKIKNKFN